MTDRVDHARATHGKKIFFLCYIVINARSASLAIDSRTRIASRYGKTIGECITTPRCTIRSHRATRCSLFPLCGEKIILSCGASPLTRSRSMLVSSVVYRARRGKTIGGCRSSILDPRSSILDPRPSTLDPRRSMTDQSDRTRASRGKKICFSLIYSNNADRIRCQTRKNNRWKY